MASRLQKMFKFNESYYFYFLQLKIFFIFENFLIRVHGISKVKNRWLKTLQKYSSVYRTQGSLRRSQENAEVTPAILLRNIIFLSKKTRKISIIKAGGY